MAIVYIEFTICNPIERLETKKYKILPNRAITFFGSNTFSHKVNEFGLGCFSL
jgi:hypothetical protein